MTRVTSPRVIIDGVSRRFGDQVALDRVSVTVEPGELVAIVGRSGAGKTTLIRCLSRSLVATEGVIRCGGQDVRTLRGAALRAHRAQVGVIYLWDTIRSFNDREDFACMAPAQEGSSLGDHLCALRSSAGGSLADMEAATVILMIVAMVMCIDVVSSRIRRAAI